MSEKSPSTHPARSATTSASSSGSSRWLSWLIAGASLVTVISVVGHYSDGAATADLLRHASLPLALLAVLLQCGTYAAEAEVWRALTCRAGCRLSFVQSVQLSFAKLFIDQALPTGGVSGSVLAASALDRHGVSPRVTAATVIVERASFLLAFGLALFAASVVGVMLHKVSLLVCTISVVTSFVAAGLAMGALSLAGREWRAPGWLARRKFVSGLLTSIRQADRAIARRVRLIVLAAALQLGVIALDTLTMLVLVRALGGTLPIEAIFVSFMMSSLFRTIGVLPGGLGTFEASSIVTLRLAGAPLGLAASATLAFRLLSFWLPLIPGVVFARRMTRKKPKRSREAPAARVRAAGRA